MSPRNEPMPARFPLEEETVHSPADCALAFAVPMRWAEFERSLGGANRDFVPRLMEANPGRSAASVWEEYALIAKYALDLSARAKRAGALIEFDATYAAWRRALERKPVTVLFAHCRHAAFDAVEFADGLYTVADVAAAVPTDFAGVLDFAVCYSLQLGQAIKARAPRSQVLMNKHETALDLRLAMLRQALHLIADGGYSYPAAMTEVRLALTHGGKSR